MRSPSTNGPSRFRIEEVEDRAAQLQAADEALGASRREADSREAQLELHANELAGREPAHSPAPLSGRRPISSGGGQILPRARPSSRNARARPLPISNGAKRISQPAPISSSSAKAGSLISRLESAAARSARSGGSTAAPAELPERGGGAHRPGVLQASPPEKQARRTRDDHPERRQDELDAKALSAGEEEGDLDRLLFALHRARGRPRRQGGRPGPTRTGSRRPGRGSLEQKERKLRRERGALTRRADAEPREDEAYRETALSARERDLEKRSSEVVGVEQALSGAA